MADCTDPQNQQSGGAFPAQQAPNSGTVQVNLTENPNNIFNPNNALSAMQTYNAFNNVVNKMLGIDARWFRAIPQQRSKDVIFQEYTLSNVLDTPLCLKVVVNAGNFPDSKYQYDLMGLQYEVPTEVQIDKKYWEEVAGFGTAPQKKDIVYLVLPNKLYQVESSYLKRGFMEQETTWVINLKKYSPEASRREGPALQETIDQYTVSEQELFGDAINADIKKIVDDKEMSAFNSTQKDFYKTLDANLKIISYNLDIQGVIAAQAFYDMNTSSIFDAINYMNSDDTITTTDDRSITAWMMPRTVDTKEYEVVWILKDPALTPPANYKIKVKGAQRFGIGDTFIVYRPGALNFYATVIDDNNSPSGIYYCQIDSDVENYLNSLNSNWSTARNYKMKIQPPINMIDGINGTSHGFRVNVYANQYIKINYGTQELVVCMNTRMEDNHWYGVVANIGNNWGQYNVHVWKESSDPDNKLTSVYYETLTLHPEQTEIIQYTVNKSDAYLTNIRLFKVTIEDEKQPLELLSYFSKDADQALIQDNADLRFSAPYVSRQR
jgi:hypothetical protein